MFKRKHKHKFEDVVLFEAIRQFQLSNQTESIPPERYVAALGRVCECGFRKVEYINVFGYCAMPHELNKISTKIKQETTDWLAGTESNRLLSIRKIKMPKKMNYTLDPSQ